MKKREKPAWIDGEGKYFDIARQEIRKKEEFMKNNGIKQANETSAKFYRQIKDFKKEEIKLQNQ